MTALRRLRDLCHRENCNLVLIAGDLFDRVEISTELFRETARCLEEMKVPVFIAPGNHDHVCQVSPYSRVIWPENVHIFHRPVLEPVVLEDLSVRIWGAGFTSMDCPALLEGFTARGEQRHQLALLHGDPLKADSPCCPVTRAQVASSGLSYLALGHIHKAGKFTAGHTLCAWPGCPMGRGFYESGSNGALVVTLGETAPELQFFDLGLGSFQELAVAVGENPAEDILLATGEPDELDSYRITLTGQREPVDTEKLTRQLEDRFFLLELVDRTEPPTDLWAAIGEDTLEGLYFRLLSQAKDRAGQQEKEILTLAARLSRRLLDGQEVKLP